MEVDQHTTGDETTTDCNCTSEAFVVHSDNDSTANITQSETQGTGPSDDDSFIGQETAADNMTKIFDVETLGFTTNHQCEADLLKILNDAHAPHGMYQEVLKWACCAKKMKCSFKPIHTKRSTHTCHLTHWQT